ncbi:MAG: CPBP family intramembrane metalloprotease [bacterium]|nr:CPBP family intramembrane metalloprotease [bacterium]
MLAEWLKKPVPKNRLWLAVILGLIAILIYNYLAELITERLGVSLPQKNSRFNLLDVSTYLILFYGAICEEILFRAPLLWAVAKWKKFSWVMASAGGLSFLFGLAHGWQYGSLFYGTLWFGIGGFGYCLIFLKCGGFQGLGFQAVAVTSLVHGFYNWTIVLLKLVNGITDM